MIVVSIVTAESFLNKELAVSANSTGDMQTGQIRKPIYLKCINSNIRNVVLVMHTFGNTL